MNKAILEQQIIEKIQTLSPQSLTEVLDFTLFLQQKEQKATSRTLGILQGKASFHIKENFEITDEAFLKS